MGIARYTALDARFFVLLLIPLLNGCDMGPNRTMWDGSGPTPLQIARQKHRTCETALTKAHNLTSIGELITAHYYLTHAIGVCPGDVKVIQAYADNVDKLAARARGAGDDDRADDWIRLLRKTFKRSLPHLVADDLDSVVALIGIYTEQPGKSPPPDAEEKNNAALKADLMRRLEAESALLTAVKQSVTAVQGEDANEHIREALAAAVPRTLSGMRDKLLRLEKLKQAASTAASDSEVVQSSTLAELDRAIRLMHRIIAVSQELSRIGSSVQEAEQALSDPAPEGGLEMAEYRIRAAENLLPRLVMPEEQLPQWQLEHIAELVQEVARLNRLLTRRIRERAAQRAWAAFRSRNADALKLAQNERTEPLAPLRTKPDGRCRKKIDRLIHFAQRLTELLPRLAGSDAAVEARRQLEQCNELVEKLKKEQQRRYCAWALERLNTATTQARAYVRQIAPDEEMADRAPIKWFPFLRYSAPPAAVVKIGEVLLEQLGPIDRQALNCDTSVAYEEVFATLFSRLWDNDLPDGKSIHTPGYKLATVQKMLRVDKLALSDF
jgi:hypothetical protein